MKSLVAFSVLVFLVFTIPLHAQVPRALSYQGVLTDSAGRPKPDGSYSFAFRLYPSASGGTALWTETKTLLVSRGLFSTALGDQVAVNLSFDAQYWLSIQVAADPELSPRIPLTSVGYTIHALKADTAQYAMTAPQQTYVDSARIAGSIPNDIVTTAKIADGAVTSAKIPTAQVVKSLNGVRDAITLRAQGGATITSSGDTITINAGTGGGGVGVQSIQNTNNTLDVLNPTGPTVTVNVKSQGIGTTQLADNSVTSVKIPAGQVVKSLNNLKDDVTLLAAGNVTITPSANTLTIAGTGWSLTGNAGTADATNFIGTTDNVPFNVRVNNQKAGRIDNTLFNTFWGYRAGNFNTTGRQNTATGYNALYSNTAGIQNTANGHGALSLNTTGNDNTANGYAALSANSTGYENTANGAYALSSNTTATQNTAIGTNALTTQSFNPGSVWSSHNVAVGYNALFFNQPTSTFNGIQNTAVGNYALYLNTTGYSNSANGYKALYSNTTGFQNTANGAYALYSNTTATQNTAIGTNALTTQSYNPGSVWPSNNVAVGYSALFFNQPTSMLNGIQNTAVGNYALNLNTTGRYNTAHGFRALYFNTDGVSNTANGNDALYNNTTGYQNTANGMQALYNNTTGSSNTAIGSYADNDLNNSSSNTIIGAYAHVGAGASNCVAIGSNAFTNVNNLALLGSTTTTQVGGYANWSNFSDGRFKTGVNEDVKGLDFIMRLRPVTYHMNVRGIYNLWGISPYGKEDNDVSLKAENKRQMDEAITNKEAIRMTGFIAQEVEKAANETGYDFDGVIKPAHDKDHYRLAYGEFVVPLVKAVQEQQQMINILKKDNDELKARLERLEKLLVK